MNKKKFIPMICVKNQKLYDIQGTSFAEDGKTLADYLQDYGNMNCDGVLIIDSSDNDENKEEFFHMLKAAARVAEIPMYTSCNIKRTEDIKKLLYAGSTKAILNLSIYEDAAMLEEVSMRFGKDKIAVSFQDAEAYIENQKNVEEYASEVVVPSLELFHSVKNRLSLPVVLCVQSLPLDKLLEYLNFDLISGVSGEVVNSNLTEINSLKTICHEKGIAVCRLEPMIEWDDLKKNGDDLVPVVVQDFTTLEVLMVAYMNRQAYQDTLQTGKMHYYSRSRKEQWLKGETSGHYQFVKSLTADCDRDTILAKVSQIGAACHTGKKSCFFQEIAKKEYTVTNPLKVFEDVYSVIEDRKVHPKEGSYTNYLFDKGIDKILKKLGEEAVEIVIAAKNPNPEEIKYEMSDFLYHMMVLMVERNISWEEITKELAQR